VVDLDDPVVRANALAQTHPFSETAFRYVGEMITREQATQPVEEVGTWAGHALTAGYCLRRVEEDRAGRRLQGLPDELPQDLDRAVRHVAGRIRTSGAEPFLLGPEEEAVALLDRMIASEISRRVDHWRDQLTEDGYAELVEYLAWWVIKGYALRAIEPDPA
jgi:hypothetical protein